MTDDQIRSRLFSEMIKKRVDQEQRKIIEAFDDPVQFKPIDNFMISNAAWAHIKSIDVDPKLVFAHPSVLIAHPKTSFHYRGMALLSRKRVQQAAVSVTNWEDGRKSTHVRADAAHKVACLYNTIISSIIEGSSNWTLDNGYRNIIATMGITLDGMFRNAIGDAAEALVKDRIVGWLKSKNVISNDVPDTGQYQFHDGTVMSYGSEPDIEFVKDGRLTATIEIKGGRDPAGALERLGAMSKSFAETPPGCTNFLVAGIVTDEMNNRLEQMGVVKVYLLDDIAQDGSYWDDFTNEVFHYAVRVI